MLSATAPPRRADDHIGLVPVEFGLGDPHRLIEVLVWQGRGFHVVTVLGQVCRLHSARYRSPAVKEE